MSDPWVIQSREGLPIRGDFDVPAKPKALVVIVHGFKGFKDWGFFPWLAESLCDHRFVACRFNMSRSGIGEHAESFDRLDLFADDTYSAQLHDCLDVVAHARRQFSGLPLFLLGHSRGGGVALLAAPRIEQLAGIITWSAISTADRWDDPTKQAWRARGYQEVLNQRTGQVMRMSTRILEDFETHAPALNILGAAAAQTAPMLVVHGSHDESVPVAEAEAIAAASPDCVKLIIGNAGHTYNAIHPLIHVPAALECAAAVSCAFIQAQL